MTTTRKTIVTKMQGQNKAHIVREFDAPIQRVWDCWTKGELLDQWWAPLPWKAIAQSSSLQHSARA